MKTAVARLYEGMFLVDSALAASDWDGIIRTIQEILEKAGAEVVSIKKWDERRLAYEIQGKSRGTYILTFFRVAGSQVQQIERSVQLSDKIMRVLILNIEGVDSQYLEKEPPAAVQAQQETESAKPADVQPEDEDEDIDEETEDTDDTEDEDIDEDDDAQDEEQDKQQ